MPILTPLFYQVLLLVAFITYKQYNFINERVFESIPDITGYPFCNLCLDAYLERAGALESLKFKAEELVCSLTHIKYIGYFGDCFPFLLCQEKNDTEGTQVLGDQITFFFFRTSKPAIESKPTIKPAMPSLKLKGSYTNSTICVPFGTKTERNV